jgi:hypothetical protein
MIKLFGILIKEEIEEDKVPYELYLYSNPVENNNDKIKEIDRIFELYENNVADAGKKLIKRYNKDLDMYIFYVSTINYYLNIQKEPNDIEHKNQNKIKYTLYDVIELESSVDRKRGRKLVNGLSEKFYNFLLYQDMIRKKIYVYVEADE